MRVLICPESFPGMLTAVQAAEAMAEGWRQRAPGDELTLAPLSAGGPGFLSSLSTAVRGEAVAATVSDPLGRPVPASLLVVDDGGGTRTAYVEAAQACGLHLLNADERRPLVTSSFGVGQLVRAALEEGVSRIVVAVGDSAINDGGAGLLCALGVGDPARLARGGGALHEMAEDALTGLDEAQALLAGVEVVVATEERCPLLGFDGTSALDAPERGAGGEQSQALETALGRFHDVVTRTCPPAPDLLTGLPRRLDREPGAGAGGGIGYALLVLGAHVESAVEVIQRARDVDSLLDRHDLVLTGEGLFDWSSLRGGVIAGIARLASTRGLPVVVLAGEVTVGRRETMALGVSGVYALVERPGEVAALMADPVGSLRSRAARVAGTWSP
ncbi:glycerate kinase family protein [Mobilicoccus massiliensis]|uniref:glycerate kinase family protein n=1 Tax=Mobilicoccus massiliensis TaxID=1522310 RepID=UPI00058BA620|nr:glycerate kinase [Mobilicoccus massiliensis]